MQVVDQGRVKAAIVDSDEASPAVRVADSTGFWASSWSKDGRLVGMKNGHLWLPAPDAPGTPPKEVAATGAKS